MNSNDIVNTFIIIIIFAIINIVSIFSVGTNIIRKNWNEYRCMPAVIPFANYFGYNPSEIFIECMQNTQANFIGSMLTPIYSIFNKINMFGESMTNFMSMFSSMTGVIKHTIGSSSLDLAEMLNRIFIALVQYGNTFQQISTAILGLFILIIYIILGAHLSILSLWNGLPGAVIRVVTN